jgi:hypothetical protein
MLMLNAANSQNIQIGTPVPTTGSWQTLRMPAYSIQYPDTFRLDTTGYSGTSLILFSNKTSEQDPYTENITLSVQDLGQDTVSLDQYVAIAKEQIKTTITNGRLLDSKRQGQGGNVHHRLAFSGKQQNVNLKWTQYYWIRKHKAWVITLTCAADQYDNFAAVADRIVDSFRLY